MPMRSMRELVLTLGALSGCVFSVLQFMMGTLGPLRALWELGAAAMLIALVLVERKAGLLVRRWSPVAVTALFIVLVPSMMTDTRPYTLLLTICSVPLVVSIIFFDEVRVVVAAALAGGVSALLARGDLPLSEGELVEFVVSGFVVNGLAALCSFGYSLQRKAELEREASRNEQLQTAERRQAQAERMALVGQLAAGVAHEINNPLAFVSSNVGLVREHLVHGGVLGDEPPAEVLAEAQLGIERIRQIVSDLKAFARDESDGGKQVHLADVVQEALRLASVGMPPGAFVDCKGLSTVPLVKASHRKLVQVVLNLLVNASDALQQGRVKEPRLVVTLRRTAKGVAVDVADNGPGISDEVKEHLFEPFFTTNPPGKGTGLGLAMSREMVRAMGGELSLTPTEQGACFTVEIPVEARRTPKALPTPRVAHIA
ncbi:MAG: hypothetical protein GQE15_35630 [Archangiaceae bacterium]|nr:hypothetical protein [Archangiaceae bacterium]